MTDPDRTRNPDDRLEVTDEDDPLSGFAYDCEFCDETLRTETAEALKEQGTTHLEVHHYDDLLPAFAERWGGDGCRNDCGYAFPTAVGEVAGFDCPECGHDHFPSFARRYLYWQIEESR